MRQSRLGASVLVCFVSSMLLLAALSSPVYAISSTFGYVSIGDLSATTFGGLIFSNVTSPSDLGTITQISVYLATGGTSAKAVIYSDNKGAPDVLLAQSANINIDGTSGTWATFEVQFAGTPNTPYWLGVLLIDAGTYYYASGVSDKAIYASSVSDAPSNFTEGTLSPNMDLSIYATYTPSSTVPPPTDSGWIQPTLLWVAVLSVIAAAIIAVILTFRKKKTNS
jgi:hypothetical protein